MRAIVMIPTYNEKSNIGDLIEEILNLKCDLQIVVVDDDSSDGTGKIVEELSCGCSKVKIIHRKGERGRGLAGIEGFKYAVQQDVDCILEMDGDFSHHPKYIPHFLEAIEDADVVIGSRHVGGGGDAERGVIRRLVSNLANWYLRSVLGLGHRDCTSGFRCFRKEVLESIDLDTLSSEGPSIVIEVLYRCKVRNYRILEIPIMFHKRRHGRSKLGFSILMHSLIIPWRLRWANPTEANYKEISEKAYKKKEIS